MSDLELPNIRAIPLTWRRYVYINTYYFKSIVAYLVMAQLVCSFIGLVLLSALGDEGVSLFSLPNGLLALLIIFCTCFITSTIMFLTSIIIHPNSHNIVKTTFFPVYHGLGALIYFAASVNILANPSYHKQPANIFSGALGMLNFFWFLAVAIIGYGDLISG